MGRFAISAATVFAGALAIGVSMSQAQNSSGTDSAENVRTDSQGRTCFHVANVRDWRAIGRKNVFIKAAGRDAQYLLTLTRSEASLPFAQTIALESRPSPWLCSNGNEKLIVNTNIGKQSIIIADVEPVQDLKTARELVKKRSEAKKSRVN